MNTPRTFIKWYIASLALLSCLLSCGPTQRSEPGREEVVFGAILPMTGSAAQYGEEARQGMDIAIEHLRSARRDEKYSFSLELQDSASDPKNSESALSVLRSRNQNMPAVISEVSGVVLALAPICERDQMVLINVGAQNPKIAGTGRFTFSIVNLANVESKQAAEFAFRILGKKRAAVIYASASYGQGAHDVFISTFKELGGNIVADTSYQVDNTDYRAQIAEVSRANPEIVYLPGTTKDMARVLRQSFEMGFHPQWLSYTAFEGQEILDLAGEAAEGVIFASAYLDWGSATGLQAEFRDAYKGKYNKIPSVYAATSFDSVLILAEAVHAKGPVGAMIRDCLAAMPSFAGASGSTMFAADGTVNKPLVFKSVKNGKFVASPTTAQ